MIFRIFNVWFFRWCVCALSNNCENTPSDAQIYLLRKPSSNPLHPIFHCHGNESRSGKNSVGSIWWFVNPLLLTLLFVSQPDCVVIGCLCCRCLRWSVEGCCITSAVSSSYFASCLKLLFNSITTTCSSPSCCLILSTSLSWQWAPSLLIR